MARQHKRFLGKAIWVLSMALLPAVAVAQPTVVPAQPTVVPAVVESQNTPALRAFDAAIQDYMTLLQRLKDEVPPLAVTDNVAEIDRASDMLAIAIERARPNARQGDFFRPDVARELRQRLSAVFQQPDVVRAIGRDDPEERSDIRVLRTNARFPGGAPLATMPASALKVLPPLPAALEYRLVGNDLVLRDRNARLILDYLPGVLPNRQSR